MRPGASVDERGATFRVWAPKPRRIELVLDGRRLPMIAAGGGWFEARAPIDRGARAGARYSYLLDGERQRPDPASRAQPDGVHGASQLVGGFHFDHVRPRRRLAEQVIYELHVGTFTRAGTFDSAAGELPRLFDLGVTAIELMPVGSFPGRRNWGYDGVAWFAPQASYGGPDGLARFVDAAHGLGLSVILDVVYNHLGPEGNYLAEFAPYFTAQKNTPWGAAIDYARPEVRAFAVENARMFVEEYQLDGLRIDAVHAIFDDSPRHIVSELAEEMQALGALVIAESDLGQASVIEPRPAGWGCDAQWSDDLHHALHAALTGERSGYYADFGGAGLVARAIENGFVHTGEWSRYRGREFGTPSKHLPGERFVVFSQNHDQIGNRGFGERLAQLRPGAAHAAAAVVLLAPAVPLLFMGEETADPAPFLYFTDHGDPALQAAVREGRRREFKMAGEIPDPQDPETFERSRVSVMTPSPLRDFYKRLLMFRRQRPALAALDKARTDTRTEGDVLMIRRWRDDDEVLAAISLGRARGRISLPAPRRGEWRLLVDAGDFGGPGGAQIVERDRALEVELPPSGVLLWGNDLA